LFKSILKIFLVVRVRHTRVLAQKYHQKSIRLRICYFGINKPSTDNLVEINTYTHTRTHARARARAHTHTHTHKICITKDL